VEVICPVEKKMFRVLQIGEDGVPTLVEDQQAVAPPPEGVVRWIDLQEQDQTQLSLLADRFGFHPLTIEDCAHFDQRPKLEEYGDYLFLVTHAADLATEPEDCLETHELHTFLGSRYLVTVHATDLPALDGVWERLKAEKTVPAHGVDFIRYLIADATVDTFVPIADQLESRIEAIEDSLLTGSADQATLEAILQTKRILVELRKLLGPQRNVILQLTRRDSVYVHQRTALYFRDVYDHLQRIVESVEATRELLENVLDAYQWTISQRTNEVVKRLTVLSAIFLPLTFLTGFFGQNFEGLPFNSNALLAVMLAACVVVPATMLWFFQRKKWF
jgi:magnesium transporter